jgi:hypothetical protein
MLAAESCVGSLDLGVRAARDGTLVHQSPVDRRIWRLHHAVAPAGG